MKQFVIILFFISLSLFSTGQVTYQSNPSLSFENFLSGVKYAYIGIDDENFQYLKENPRSINAQAILGLISYLEYLGFENVTWGTSSTIPKNFPSVCDLAVVSPAWDIEDYAYKNISLTFYSCNGDEFNFESSKKIRIDAYTNIENSFYNLFQKMYQYKKRPYSFSQKLSIEYELTTWSEEKLKKQFKDNATDSNEGIYEGVVKNEKEPRYKVGVIKNDKGYDLIYISGAVNYLDWKEGELKAKLNETATTSLYKAQWKMADKEINDGFFITFEKGIMNLITPDNDKSLFIKLYPTISDKASNTKPLQSSGSGFAISSDGYIVTNNHVIEGSASIRVRGINGDFQTAYDAKVIIVDKNNDLAIIKINDSNIKTLGTIPYVINSKSSDVGNAIFVLGYPLRASMGDEIKLTNGIISSKSGFQGDVTSYQISAPVQPGNSGGPLFDEKGNLVGIINAKHTLAENASYAIKSQYLLNLLDLMPTSLKLQSNSLIIGKTLADQVKTLKQFVYIIEVNPNK